MADSKLLDLPAATSLDGTEVVYGVQTGNDVKLTTAQIATLAAAAAAGSDKQVMYNANGVTSGSNNFVYDYTNSRVGFLTNAPTHTLTLGSTSTGITYYQTSDQTVNYSRVLSSFVTLNTQPTYQITTQNAGTVTVPAAIQVNAGGIFTTWDQSASAQGTSSKIATGIGGTGVVGGAGLISFQGSTLQGSSGTQNFIGITPTVNQTATTASNILYISPLFSAVGSGAQYLINAGTNTGANGSGIHSTSFNVTTGGNVTNSGTIVAGGLITSGAGFAGTQARMALGAASVNGTQMYGSGAITTGTNFGNTAGSAATFGIGAGTINSTTSSGTIASMGANIINVSTLVSTSAVTLTDSATLYVSGTPIASTNVTITNAYAAIFAAGNVKIGALATSGNRNVYADTAGVLRTTAGFSESTLFVATAGTTVTNTVTPTSIIPTGVGSMTIAANQLKVGKSLILKGRGIYSDSVTAPTLTVTVKLGSVTLATGTVTAFLGSSVNAGFSFEVLMSCRSVGATGTLQVDGSFPFQSSAAQGISALYLNNAGSPVTIDTTTAQLLDIQVTWSAASASNILTTNQVTLQSLGE